ncbi:putative DNA mismatch repair protein (Mlh3) [Aspergillus homomorphus CBS 101889]|uniref:MutL C-terminal dimerisation domain-containing protein n=1 Tax=Aspergillus homomorphus (strain CBS 101889) TaxID=1450537 RepID=A0A395IBJ7_ASPHC|nr:hypothetical protein BO97DRAFT_467820 [Aspergillus homomorphus CBS 101889]RAL16503.1 hypothetical protein BO97DRAFT_467820 [Aspergillus homomorphus CBS 101889]
MNTNDRTIQPLPPAVVSKIKSSTSITSLKGVIIELIKNALDASARTVYVTVDFPRGGCIVEDDGDGIPPVEFHPSGGLGKAHHTSQLCAERVVYGHNGSFLASLSALSMLTITSRHFRHTSTNTIAFHHATPVVRLTPAPAYHELRFSAHGTSVTVNDLFGNMPVRVKSRALALQKSDEVDRQWDDLKQLLVALMIANNQLAKLVIMDANKEKKHCLYPKNGGHETGVMLDLQRINSILNQACLVDARGFEHWDVVSASVSGFRIQVAISCIPSPTKKVQFVSLGTTPLLPSSSANIFYTEVNRLFALSDFGAAKISLPQSVKDRAAVDSYGTLMESSSKVSAKWPMFYIRIITQHRTDLDGDTQGVPESDQTVQRILDVLGAMLNEFLSQRGLRPRAPARKRKIEATVDAVKPDESEAERSDTSDITEKISNRHIKTPNLRRTPTVSHHFGGWSRIKSASTNLKNHSANLASKPTIAINRNLPQRSALPPEVAPGDEGVAQRFRKQNHYAACNETNPSDKNSDQIIPWTDPYTGRGHLINSRTGQSIGAESSALSLRPRSTGSFLTKRSIKGQDRPRSSILPRARNTWVENLLGDWKSPIFGRPERPIGALDTEASLRTDTPITLQSHNFGMSKYRGKLRKHDLFNCQIIAQVDRKFILAEVRPSSSNPNSTLILIDQHAADERCRVEALLASFLPTKLTDAPPAVRLADPIIFEIPPTETSIFRRYQQFYRGWGVDYSIEQGPKDATAFVFVRALPTLIAERCRTEPELATELIREDIWQREESRRGLGLRKDENLGISRSSTGQGTRDDATSSSSSSSIGSSIVASKSSWVSRLDGCPRGIVDLLNSRACRSAIMFNDILSVEDCRSLVCRLANCTFPFQCAHGRPSMIPILDIKSSISPGLASDLDWDRTDEYTCDETFDGGNFTDAYKRWQCITSELLWEKSSLRL